MILVLSLRKLLVLSVIILMVPLKFVDLFLKVITLPIRPVLTTFSVPWVNTLTHQTTTVNNAQLITLVPNLRPLHVNHTNILLLVTVNATCLKQVQPPMMLQLSRHSALLASTLFMVQVLALTVPRDTNVQM